MRIPTTIHDGNSHTAEPGLYLVVMSHSAPWQSYRLAGNESWVIGRDRDGDVRLEDERASRQHFRLAVTDDAITITDLKSANGTWLRDAKLKAEVPTSVTLGETITVGSTMLVVKRTQPDPTAVWASSHETLMRRVRQVCEQGSAPNAQFAIARLVLGMEKTKLPEPPALAAMLIGKLRPPDMLAACADDEYDLLLHSMSLKNAQDRFDDVIAALSARRIAARGALAHYPYQGRTADALLAKARELVHGLVNSDQAATIVEDPAMKDIYAKARRLAASDVGVLILGETGVGKNVLARHIHETSRRSEKPFQELNCTSIPANLVESELFGHEKGVFTTALAKRIGIIEEADGGTVFLDEVGELPLEVQVKLNQVLQSNTFKTVGGREVHVDVRFIAATNRDLAADVKNGRFREDVYYRLNIATLTLPPLRQRRLEIIPLAKAFVLAISKKQSISPPLLSDAAARALQEHSWPGNIRELYNAIQLAMAMTSGNEITLDDLPDSMVRQPSAPPPPNSPAVNDEHRQLLEALLACQYNQTRTAARLGIQRLKVGRLMKKYGMKDKDDAC